MQQRFIGTARIRLGSAIPSRSTFTVNADKSGFGWRATSWGWRTLGIADRYPQANIVLIPQQRHSDEASPQPPLILLIMGRIQYPLLTSYDLCWSGVQNELNGIRWSPVLRPLTYIASNHGLG